MCSGGQERRGYKFEPWRPGFFLSKLDSFLPSFGLESRGLQKVINEFSSLLHLSLISSSSLFISPSFFSSFFSLPLRGTFKTREGTKRMSSSDFTPPNYFFLPPFPPLLYLPFTGSFFPSFLPEILIIILFFSPSLLPNRPRCSQTLPSFQVLI